MAIHTITYKTNSVADTQALGNCWGSFMKTLDAPLCIALCGDLGTGKTHFSQGVARGFGITGEVTSPTFALMNTYETYTDVLYHFDAYRLDSEQELSDIGFDEFTDGTKSIVEWADKFPQNLPEETVWITIQSLDDSTRIFEVKTEYLSVQTLKSIGGNYVFGD